MYSMLRLAVIAAFIALLRGPVLWVCRALSMKLIVLDGGRINPLCLVPEYLLRRHALADGTPPRRTVLLMESCANRALLEIWRRHFKHLTLGPRLFDLVSQAFPKGRYSDVVERIYSHQYKNIFQATGPKLTLSPDMTRAGREFLERMGLGENDWYVCVVNRDAAYLQAAHPGRDWSYHDYRNSDIRSYIPAMRAISERGGWVFRMGSVVERPLPESQGNRIVDYATKFRSPELDLFLLAHCRFLVVGNTGLSAIASAFGRRSAFTNLIPLSHSDPFLAQDRFIPKLLRHSDGHLLSFDEMRAIGLFDSTSGAFHTEYFRSQGLTPLENEAQDITALVLEMMDGDDLASWRPVQDAFKARYFASKGDWRTETDIAASFLKRHVGLLPADMLAGSPASQAAQDSVA